MNSNACEVCTKSGRSDMCKPHIEMSRRMSGEGCSQSEYSAFANIYQEYPEVSYKFIWKKIQIQSDYNYDTEEVVRKLILKHIRYNNERLQ